MIPFQLTILGSGSAVPSQHRAATSQLLRYDNHFILIDCAEGTQLIMQRLHISPMKIEKILISHLHGDHYFGLFGLINTMHLNGRTIPLDLYAPAPLYNILQMHLEASDTLLRFPIDFHPLFKKEYHLLYADNQIVCHAFPLKHRIPTWGFRFDELRASMHIREEVISQYNLSFEQIRKIKEGEDLVLTDGTVVLNQELVYHERNPRSYAYCTDTAYFEALARHVHRADLLYHEATFGADLQDNADATFHSTSTDAAKLAKLAGVGKLIIGHFSSRYKDVQPLVDEAKAIFPATLAAFDGIQIDI